ncbi:hypothetical protein N3K66_001010 [Trichothecium roseum]|uniref:Uncharacterized protein n=1 Tax=Trichothecium roseum TaxID=47278 RepID=A0ACC0VDF1_9HYPO|nr:hypothetical protein N3K66_001010 [Trichothecium roseum]
MSLSTCLRVAEYAWNDQMMRPCAMSPITCPRCNALCENLVSRVLNGRYWCRMEDLRRNKSERLISPRIH